MSFINCTLIMYLYLKTVHYLNLCNWHLFMNAEFKPRKHRFMNITDCHWCFKTIRKITYGKKMQRNLHHCQNPVWNNRSLGSCPWMENRPKKFKHTLTNHLRVVENFIKCVEEVFIKYFPNENNYTCNTVCQHILKGIFKEKSLLYLTVL